MDAKRLATTYLAGKVHGLASIEPLDADDRETLREASAELLNLSARLDHCERALLLKNHIDESRGPE